MNRPEEAQTFQQRLEKLRALVEELESGDLPLEAAVSRFEEGRKLRQSLQAELDAYEKRLEVLTKEDGAEGEGQEDEPPQRRPAR
jgi:exodeoxyribonuclease VII small subunit